MHSGRYQRLIRATAAALALCALGTTVAGAQETGAPSIAMYVDLYNIVQTLASTQLSIVALPLRASIRVADALSLELVARRAAGSLGSSTALAGGLALYPGRSSPLGAGVGAVAGLGWGRLLTQRLLFLPVNVSAAYGFWWRSRLTLRLGIGFSFSVPLSEGSAFAWDIAPSVCVGVWN